MVAKNNKSGASRRVTQNKTPNKGWKNPPQLPATILAGHRFRFVVNQDGGTQAMITAADLLDLLCMAVSSNSAYRLLDGIKLKEVEAWASNGAGNVSNTIELEYVNDKLGFGAPGNTFSDTAIGLANIAHICAKPSKKSLAAQWINLIADPRDPNVIANYDLFRLTCPQGTIVDVVVSLSFQDNDDAQTVTGSVAGATSGFLYYRYLDSTSGKTLVPIGANYI